MKKPQVEPDDQAFNEIREHSYWPRPGLGMGGTMPEELCVRQTSSPQFLCLKIF